MDTKQQKLYKAELEKAQFMFRVYTTLLEWQSDAKAFLGLQSTKKSHYPVRQLLSNCKIRITTPAIISV